MEYEKARIAVLKLGFIPICSYTSKVSKIDDEIVAIREYFSCRDSRIELFATRNKNGKLVI